jgi:hypothetical protein
VHDHNFVTKRKHRLERAQPQALTRYQGGTKRVLLATVDRVFQRANMDRSGVTMIDEWTGTQRGAADFKRFEGEGTPGHRRAKGKHAAVVEEADTMLTIIEFVAAVREPLRRPPANLSSLWL